VDRFFELLRCATAILGLWSITSVIVAVPVAALFRVQARAERNWHELDRRRAWRDALR
jgi:hypothetical protein